MKKLIAIVSASFVFSACNVNVDTEHKSDSTNATIKVDTTTINKLGDSAKEKLKDAGQEIKKEWQQHFSKDSSAKKLQ